MTRKIADQPQGPIALNNVAAFMVMTHRLLDRRSHLQNIGVCSGPSGYGKTCSSIFAQNKTGALRVEVMNWWRPRDFMLAVLREAGVALPKKRTGEIKHFTQAQLGELMVMTLGENPCRPLIIDEADTMAARGYLSYVRDLAEHARMPVILIGEENLPATMLLQEKVHNRVLHWMTAQPCDLADARHLADAYASHLDIADDLLNAICKRSQGRPRRIVKNFDDIAEWARNKAVKTIDLKTWGDGPLDTGRPPSPRRIAPFLDDRNAA